jgi:competence protein ComGF
MYVYKKGFTLIEVLLVVVLIIAMFSMSLSLLSSFSSPNYVEKDIDEIKSILGQIKYLKMAGEKNINIQCEERKISLYLDDQIIDEKQLKTFRCDKDLKLSNASSTYKININQYGYVSFQRI